MSTRAKPLVAILTRREAFHEEVLKGFFTEQKTLKREDVFDTQIISIEAINLKTLSQQTEELVALKPDAVVTIGTLAAQMAAYTIVPAKIGIPLVFCGVTNFHDAGIERFWGNPPDSFMTGISLGIPSYLTIAQSLLWLKPHTKSVFIPYSPLHQGGILTNAARLIKEYLTSRGVAVETAAISTTTDLPLLFESKVVRNDVILTLEGCFTDSSDCHKAITDLCNREGATYFSNSLEAVQNGAALGLVTYPATIGSKALYECLSILAGKHMAENGSLQILKNEARKIAINLTACQKQGIVISPEMLYFLQRTRV